MAVEPERSGVVSGEPALGESVKFADLVSRDKSGVLSEADILEQRRSYNVE
jgi:hypothetical protein